MFEPPLHVNGGLASTRLQSPPGHSESCWQLAVAFEPPTQEPRRLQSAHATFDQLTEFRMSSSQLTTVVVKSPHCEHHMFMHVPCYHLPRAHRLLKAKGVTVQFKS